MRFLGKSYLLPGSWSHDFKNKLLDPKEAFGGVPPLVPAAPAIPIPKIVTTLEGDDSTEKPLTGKKYFSSCMRTVQS